VPHTLCCDQFWPSASYLYGLAVVSHSLQSSRVSFLLNDSPPMIRAFDLNLACSITTPSGTVKIASMPLPAPQALFASSINLAIAVVVLLVLDTPPSQPNLPVSSSVGTSPSRRSQSTSLNVRVPAVRGLQPSAPQWSAIWLGFTVLPAAKSLPLPIASLVEFLTAPLLDVVKNSS